MCVGESLCVVVSVVWFVYAVFFLKMYCSNLFHNKRRNCLCGRSLILKQIYACGLS